MCDLIASTVKATFVLIRINCENYTMHLERKCSLCHVGFKLTVEHFTESNVDTDFLASFFNKN